MPLDPIDVSIRRQIAMEMDEFGVKGFSNTTPHHTSTSKCCRFLDTEWDIIQSHIQPT